MKRTAKQRQYLTELLYRLESQAVEVQTLAYGDDEIIGKALTELDKRVFDGTAKALRDATFQIQWMLEEE